MALLQLITPRLAAAYGAVGGQHQMSTTTAAGGYFLGSTTGTPVDHVQRRALTTMVEDCLREDGVKLYAVSLHARADMV